MGEPHTVTPETKQTISVVIPALDEAPGIATVLSRFIPTSVSEVILADGGSKDDTPDIADAYGAIFVRSDRGRARQMNAGVKAATGDIILFCHADTLLPDRFEDQIRKTLSVPGTSAGAFMLRFIEQDASPSLRFIAWTANLRSRYAQLPYGDQGIFLKRSTFEAVEGFPDAPIMEDVRLIRKLKAKGRIRLCPSYVETSARRYIKMGIWKRVFINKLAVIGFYLGYPAERIARLYDPE